MTNSYFNSSYKKKLHFRDHSICLQSMLNSSHLNVVIKFKINVVKLLIEFSVFNTYNYTGQQSFTMTNNLSDFLLVLVLLLKKPLCSSEKEIFYRNYSITTSYTDVHSAHIDLYFFIQCHIYTLFQFRKDRIFTEGKQIKRGDLFVHRNLTSLIGLLNHNPSRPVTPQVVSHFSVRSIVFCNFVISIKGVGQEGINRFRPQTASLRPTIHISCFHTSF